MVAFVNLVLKKIMMMMMMTDVADIFFNACPLLIRHRQRIQIKMFKLLLRMY